MAAGGPRFKIKCFTVISVSINCLALNTQALNSGEVQRGWMYLDSRPELTGFGFRRYKGLNASVAALGARRDLLFQGGSRIDAQESIFSAEDLAT